jgi:hypothetical protein
MGGQGLHAAFMNDRRVRSIVSGVMHILDGNQKRSAHLSVACVGAIATFALWWGHLTHPAVFDDIFVRGRVSPLWLLILLAPPFIATFGFANALLSKPTPEARDGGPMTGYIRQQESEKKWKIAVASGIAPAVNLLLMFITSMPA